MSQPTAWQPQPPYPGPAGPPHPPQPQHAFPHSQPRPYHEMYRTWNYAWWRPTVGLVLVPIGFITVQIALLPVLLVGLLVEGGTADYGERFGSSLTEEITPASLLYLNLALASLTLWTWLLIRLLHNMRPRWLSSVAPRLRWKFLLACLGLALVALIASFVVGLLVPESANPDTSTGPNELTGTLLALALVMLLTTPLQAAGEEYFFRGYLLQAVGSLTRLRWVAILLTAAVFACAHLQFDPPLFLDRFMFGVIAAWLVIRTGGLEAGIAFHVLNNYVALGFALVFGDLGSALDPPDVSWWNVPVTLTQTLVYAALVVWVAQRMRVQTHTRPPAQTGAL